MGKQSLIMILATTIIVGSVFVSLSNRQLRSVDEVADQTYASQARHFANSYAQHGIAEFRRTPELIRSQVEGTKIRLVEYNDETRDAVVDITKLDYDGNYRVESNVKMVQGNEPSIYVGETIVDILYINTEVVYKYIRYTIFVELWNDLYRVNSVNAEEQIIFEEVGLWNGDIVCPIECQWTSAYYSDIHAPNCSHTILLSQLPKLLEDPDLHAKLCPILHSNGGIHHSVCNVLDLRIFLRGNRPFHDEVRRVLERTGLPHYLSLVSYYGYEVPPYFHFGESMAAYYDDMADVFLIDLQDVSDGFDLFGIELDLEEFVYARRKLVSETEYHFEVTSWQEYYIERDR